MNLSAIFAAPNLGQHMKLNKLIICVILAVFAAASLSAQEKKVIKGFSGGMMINGGYLFGSDNPYGLEISSLTLGMGGCAKLHFSDHFRAGFEGYFSSAPLRDGVESGSHNKVFWTGVLADFFCKKGKFVPYAGLTVGGGMETAFYMFEGDKHDWELESKAVLHKQPFLAIDPYAGVEYKVGKALRLTLKADWLLAINSEGFNMPTGPRLYFGCIFAH